MVFCIIELYHDNRSVHVLLNVSPRDGHPVAHCPLENTELVYCIEEGLTNSIFMEMLHPLYILNLRVVSALPTLPFTTIKRLY